MTVDRRLMWQFILYVALDVVCIGAGMGVPALCILLGAFVGWRVVGLLGLAARPLADALTKVLVWSGITSGVTFLLMAALWGWCLAMLFDPAANIAEFGMPLILFEPRASFIGWLVLMIVVSPALQFLTTVLGAHVALMRRAGSASRPAS